MHPRRAQRQGLVREGVIVSGAASKCRARLTKREQPPRARVKGVVAREKRLALPWHRLAGGRAPARRDGGVVGDGRHGTRQQKRRAGPHVLPEKGVASPALLLDEHSGGPRRDCARSGALTREALLIAVEYERQARRRQQQLRHGDDGRVLCVARLRVARQAASFGDARQILLAQELQARGALFKGHVVLRVGRARRLLRKVAPRLPAVEHISKLKVAREVVRRVEPRQWWRDRLHERAIPAASHVAEVTLDLRGVAVHFARDEQVVLAQRLGVRTKGDAEVGGPRRRLVLDGVESEAVDVCVGEPPLHRVPQTCGPRLRGRMRHYRRRPTPEAPAPKGEPPAPPPRRGVQAPTRAERLRTGLPTVACQEGSQGPRAPTGARNANLRRAPVDDSGCRSGRRGRSGSKTPVCQRAGRLRRRNQWCPIGCP
eukprot:3540788-Prymnesium_polylepis.1